MLLSSLLLRGLLVLAMFAGMGVSASAAELTPPDTLIRQISADVVEAVKSDKAIQGGDLQKIIATVDAKVMPHVNFQRMTATASGHYWRQATLQQQKQLQDEFKTLLVRTYAGALTQVTDQTISVKRLRATPEDAEVVVRSEVRGRGDPIQLDYRMERSPDGWRIYDVNVLGIWLADQYRNSFAQEIGANGIDGLIKALADRNKKAANGGK